MTDNLNPDGTPKVPEESVSLPKAEYDKLVEELAQKNQAVSNLTNEVIELRGKKQLTETEKATLEAKLKELNDLKNLKPGEISPESINSIINQKLEETFSKKEHEDRLKNRDSAIQNFKNSNKEFSEANDVGGLKFSAFQKKLSMFNMDNQKSVEDFKNVFDNALLLLKRDGVVKDTVQNPYSHTPSNEAPKPPVDNLDDNLTMVEQKIIDKTFGGDKKRYLEQKRKRPDYVETLLKYAR